MEEEGEKLAAMMRKRSKLVEELGETELSYVKQLLLVRSLFLDPARRLSLADTPVLSSKEMATLFLNVEELMHGVKDTCGRLQERWKDWSDESTIGDLFAQRFTEEFVMTYITYITGFEASLKLMEGIAKTSTTKKPHPFVAFQLQQEQKPACAGLSLGALLVAPVQRIPRYILLLKDIAKNTPEDHPDHAAVHKAKENMLVIAAKINKLKGTVEDFMGLLQFNGRFSKEQQEAMQLQSRVDRFVLGDCPLLEKKGSASKQRTLYVLSDMLLCIDGLSGNSWDALTMAWRADLCNTSTHEAVVEGETLLCIAVRERSATFPFSSVTKHYFEIPLDNGNYYYKKLKTAIRDAKKSLRSQLRARNRDIINQDAGFVHSMSIQPADLQVLLANSEELRVNKGAALSKANEEQRHLYYIETGAARTTRRFAGCYELDINKLGPGTFFGIMEFLDPSSSPKSGVTVEACQDRTLAHKIPFTNLEQVIEMAASSSREWDATLAARLYLSLSTALASRVLREPLREVLEYLESDKNLKQLGTGAHIVAVQGRSPTTPTRPRRSSFRETLAKRISTTSSSGTKESSLRNSLTLDTPKVPGLRLSSSNDESSFNVMIRDSPRSPREVTPRHKSNGLYKNIKAGVDTMTPGDVSCMSKFKLKDRVLHIFKCKLVAATGKGGKIFVTERHFCFYGKSITKLKSVSLVVPAEQILGVQLSTKDSTKLLVHVGKKLHTFQFADSQASNTAYFILLSVYGDAGLRARRAHHKAHNYIKLETKPGGLDKSLGLWEKFVDKFFGLLEVKEGTTVLRQGNVDQYVYFVQEGSFREKHRGEDGDVEDYRKLRAGALFGVENFIMGGLSPLSIVALKAGRLRRLDFDRLQKAMEEPGAVQFLRLLYERMAKSLRGTVLHRERRALEEFSLMGDDDTVLMDGEYEYEYEYEEVEIEVVIEEGRQESGDGDDSCAGAEEGDSAEEEAEEGESREEEEEEEEEEKE